MIWGYPYFRKHPYNKWNKITVWWLNRLRGWTFAMEMVGCNSREVSSIKMFDGHQCCRFWLQYVVYFPINPYQSSKTVLLQFRNLCTVTSRCYKLAGARSSQNRTYTNCQEVYHCERGLRLAPFTGDSCSILESPHSRKYNETTWKYTMSSCEFVKIQARSQGGPSFFLPEDMRFWTDLTPFVFCRNPLPPRTMKLLENDTWIICVLTARPSFCSDSFVATEGDCGITWWWGGIRSWWICW